MPEGKSLIKGIIENIGEKNTKFNTRYAGLKAILGKMKKVDAVGHRVVHGGEKFKEPTIIDKNVIFDIKDCCKLAPLHNPANLEGIIAARGLLGNEIPQVAVFDTAFYSHLPKFAYIYGCPYEFYQKYGIRRYGFHGTSHEYVAKEASLILRQPLTKLKLITCHLGNGCSITATKKGIAVDTSMGFTPLEGLIMGTRCGDIDPAIITYLQRDRGWDVKKIDRVLNEQSGLKGISGISNDMRQLRTELKKGNQRAKLAIDMFIYRARKYIGAYLAVLGGSDAVVFTAGIGASQPSIRRRICSGLFTHLRIKPRILVIPTQEELMIARQTFKLIRKN